MPSHHSSITLAVMKDVKIVDVRLLPLVGQTPDGGWDAKFSDPDRNLHTLVEVVTDQGVTGLGSVYTSKTLVQGGDQLVKPFLIGASAIDPGGDERDASSTYLLAGPGWRRHAHDFGHRHRAVGYSR